MTCSRRMPRHTLALVLCSACGRENLADARFCQACGAPITAGSDHPEERKVVTVLFTDVAGSTALGERLDPELLRRVMWRYFDAVQAVLERHGGVVEKFIGDAVMAVFGIPAVREDDALRAVRAASELGERLAVLNAELESEHGVVILTRTGINTGEVIVGGGAGDQKLATGDAVNVAARLDKLRRRAKSCSARPRTRPYATLSSPRRSSPSRRRGRPSRSRPAGCSGSGRTFLRLRGRSRRLSWGAATSSKNCEARSTPRSASAPAHSPRSSERRAWGSRASRAS